ncbi:MAG: hypothetical protein NTW74_15265 [Acidobacteria bacterium]|nr:hypothetical protein [Acidobacteriota bacterium]
MRILSNAGQVLRPVSILLLDEAAGLRIEVSRAGTRDVASAGNKKSKAPLDEVTILAVPYGRYRVVVKSPLFLQVGKSLEIDVNVPVFSRSIFLSPNLPMIRWTVDPAPRTTLQVEDHAVPQAFAWVQLRHLHRVADPIEGRLDANGSIAVAELAAGEYVATIYPVEGEPWAVVVRYPNPSSEVVKIIR